MPQSSELVAPRAERPPRTTMISGIAHVNGLKIAYDTFGQASDPAVVLVMGLGAQRISWPDEVCEDLAAAGRFVVRFDNRDAGESTHLEELGEPSALDLLLRRAPYQLDDMADDVVGLLDVFDLGDVHLVGASLGGYIAQTVAIRHPGRLRTLTLIMTSTGSRRVGRPDPLVMLGLARARRRSASSREEAVERALRAYQVIGSPGYPFDEERARRLAALAYDRDYDRGGHRRQLAASLAQPDRTTELRRLAIPTLVVHGLDDRLVSPTGGLALAGAIPAAKFLGLAGMGHDLPRQLWPEVTAELVRHTTDAKASTSFVSGVN